VARGGITGGDALDLGPWLTFPMAEIPRPIVLLSSPVRLGGFVDTASKEAWLTGAVVSEVPLPTGVLELATAGHTHGQASTVVHISSAERSEAEFLCDRGPRRLPAYQLSSPALLADCIVLDPEVECWWPPRADLSSVRSGFGSARVEADDLTIHFPAHGGVLTQFHHAEFIEYDTCVVGRAITTERQVAPGTAVAAVGIVEHVVGHLKRPLAARVLLDSRGQPLAVTNAHEGTA
jgi:hypothetical protein